MKSAQGDFNVGVRLDGNEVVLTPKQWDPIAPYLKAAKAPGKDNEFFAYTGLVVICYLVGCLFFALLIYAEGRYAAIEEQAPKTSWVEELN